MESFFNSLDPHFKNERRKIAQLVLEKNPELAHYLFNEWKLWISKVNESHSNLTKFLSKTSELLKWYEGPHENGRAQILSGLESEKQTTSK